MYFRLRPLERQLSWEEGPLPQGSRICPGALRGCESWGCVRSGASSAGGRSLRLCLGDGVIIIQVVVVGQHGGGTVSLPVRLVGIRAAVLPLGVLL